MRHIPKTIIANGRKRYECADCHEPITLVTFVGGDPMCNVCAEPMLTDVEELERIYG